MIIATDLDGTLLNDEKIVGEQEKEWLLNYLHNGNVLAFLTSRNQADVKKCAPWIFEQVQCKKYIGFDEGARVLLPDDHIVDMPMMTLSNIHPVIEASKASTDGFTAFFQGGHYNIVFSQIRLAELKVKAALKREKVNQYLLWDAFQKKTKEAFWKIKLSVKQDEAFTLYQRLRTEFPMLCITLNEGRVEIMHGSSGKLGALEYICKVENVPLSEVLYFGDEGNDLYCIERTNSYAMGNAVQWVKDAAQHVTDDNNHHGVLNVLKDTVF